MMQKRTNESPMDFEWQTKAPGDVTSPFYRLAMEHDKQKKKREELPLSISIHTFNSIELTMIALQVHSVFSIPPPSHRLRR